MTLEPNVPPLTSENMILLYDGCDTYRSMYGNRLSRAFKRIVKSPDRMHLLVS